MKTWHTGLWGCICVGSVLVSGCTHTTHKARRDQPAPLPASIAAEFAYTRSDSATKVTVVEDGPDSTLKRVLLAAPGFDPKTNRWIELDYYDVKRPSTGPAGPGLPMSGGGYSIERLFASYFAKCGYSAVIVHREKVPQAEQLLENLNPLMKRMVLDHRRVIDWLETEPHVDSHKVGLFGISLGGIKGAILTPLESRVQAAVIGLAGGDLPYILIHSTEPGIIKRRDEYLKTNHLTPQEAEDKLRKVISCDPLALAPYVDPKKVMLVLALFDTVVPTEKGMLLKEKMGKPETIVLPTGHYTAALSIPYIKTQASSFFEKRFAEGPPRRLPPLASSRGRAKN